MAKKLVVIAMMVLLLTVLATDALASTEYLCFSGDCNVRTGPGLSYSILGSVKMGSTLNYNGRTRYDSRGVAWYAVDFGYGEGWVSSVYASFSSRGGAVMYGSGAGGSWDCVHSPGDVEERYFVEATDGDTYVRTGPGLGYAATGVLYLGNQVEFADDVSYDNRDVAWLAVYWGDNIAWVSSVYTSLYLQ